MSESEKCQQTALFRHVVFALPAKADAYFGADSPVVAASGGTIFITKEVGLSFGPKGPGTLFFTGGRLLRNAAIARLSSLVRFANACQAMIGASSRPSGRLPFVIAVTISSVDHLPIPVSRSGVRFGPWNTPRPGISNPTSEPPRKRAMSGLPEEIPRRVAVVATTQGHEIFAALDL
jgi:hypothetical protein